jgi:phenylalanyl-tRNA synthetase beta chain
MKFTISWLKEYLDTNATIEEICDKLTEIGLEVEEVENHGETLSAFTVAQILSAEKHPDADKLKICEVDVGGTENMKIVCGAPNAREGIKVPYAKLGTIIPTNGMKIKPVKIRGVESCGMLCSSAELGVAEDSEGILELPSESEIGQPFAKYIGKDDCLIEIAITPNRGDCLGVYGIARDLAAAGLGKLKKPEIKNSAYSIKNPIEVAIEDKNLCPWYCGVYIKNLKNKESPKWLKDKLESIGKKSISALVDITNYLTFAFGRPAHIYDADKISGNITVRYANKGEKIITLDEVEYTLNNNIPVIADEKGILGVAGIIGGASSGCSSDTKNAFLEVALFDDIAISKAGRELAIDSDARYRFERKVDFDSYLYTSYAVNLINEICGGENSEIEISGSVSYNRRVIELDCDKIRSITALDLSNERIADILTSLEFEKLSDNQFKIPSFRNDIEIIEDIAEEIARLEGFQKLPKIKFKPVKNAKSKKSINEDAKKKVYIRRILASNGLDESISYSFCSSELAKEFAESKSDKELVFISNPISSDLDSMRPNLLINLLQSLQKNFARNIESGAFFEQGAVFKQADDNSNTLFNQAFNISGVLSGNKNDKSALNEAQEYSIFDAKKNCEDVLSQFINPQNINISDNNELKYYHPGKSGLYKLGKNIIAAFGEIHPTIAKKFDIKKSIYAFEVFYDNLPSPKPKKSFSKGSFEISNLQKVNRDFAFIFDKDIQAQNIIGTIKKADKKYIKDISIFDIYEGEHIEAGKKSVALKVTLEPQEKTFTDEEIDNISNKIISSVENSFNAKLRA